MTRLSTDTMQPNLAGARYGEWANFTIFASIDPLYDVVKRFEYVRYLEKVANRIEDDLNVMMAGGGAGSGSFGVQIQVPGPVMFTPQFGQRTARVTFSGFMLSSKQVASPLTDKPLDHDGQIVSGPSTIGGTIHPSVNTTADSDDDVRALKAALETASAGLLGRIFRIELNGVIYGQGGRSFP